MIYAPNTYFVVIFYYIGLIATLIFLLFLLYRFIHFIIKKLHKPKFKPTVIYVNNDIKKKPDQSEYIQSCWDEVNKKYT